MGNLINIYRLVEEQCSDKKDETRTFSYVSRDKNSICTLARMSISLKIPYRKTNMQVRIEIRNIS